MNPWNAESLSKRFESGARSTLRYVDECKWKVKRNDSYKNVHDEHLAKYHVYDFIHGKTLLDSPQRFFAAMNSLLSNDVDAPHDAFDKNCYIKWRAFYINSLILEVKKAWPELA